MALFWFQIEFLKRKYGRKGQRFPSTQKNNQGAVFFDPGAGLEGQLPFYTIKNGVFWIIVMVFIKKKSENKPS